MQIHPGFQYSHISAMGHPHAAPHGPLPIPPVPSFFAAEAAAEEEVIPDSTAIVIPIVSLPQEAAKAEVPIRRVPPNSTMLGRSESALIKSDEVKISAKGILAPIYDDMDSAVGALLDIHGSNSAKRIKIEGNLEPNVDVVEINNAASANAVPS